MNAQRAQKRPAKPASTRATASLPPDVYQTLKDIAQQKRVSVAWVIRDAAESYIADQWPLLKDSNR